MADAILGNQDVAVHPDRGGKRTERRGVAVAGSLGPEHGFLGHLETDAGELRETGGEPRPRTGGPGPRELGPLGTRLGVLLAPLPAESRAEHRGGCPFQMRAQRGRGGVNEDHPPRPGQALGGRASVHFVLSWVSAGLPSPAIRLDSRRCQLCYSYGKGTTGGGGAGHKL